ncbi:MAG: hypothetical protein H8D22_00700, partial [Candidatus Cloacimonetes bacterium]|nr:hypothetical protein [Candidatus Cloacimonadota bacterium]
MRRTITTFGLLLIAAISFAETHIPGGDVSGIWTIDGSPYIIDGEINIPIDSTLIIEPGVQVIFSEHYKFNIYGRLLAEGTVTDTIIFTAQDTTIGWHGLRFQDTNITSPDTSKLIYCKLEYGKASGSGLDECGGAIFFDNSSRIMVINCLIRRNTANWGGGISCHLGSNPNLEKVIITENSAFHYGGGVECAWGGNPSLYDVIISKNTACFEGGGIYCYEAGMSLENVAISENVAYNNGAEFGGGGISSIYSNMNLTDVTIIDNIDYGGGGGGIFMWGSIANLNSVVIADNKTKSKGGGIYCEGHLNLEDVTIIRNFAKNKGGGIWCRDSSGPQFNPFNRCNIFMNFAGIGNDIYAWHSPNINVIVDTFTVLQPDNHFAYPYNSNFTFDILNCKVEQVNQDLYVSPIGSNNNSGLTPGDPLLTISYALAKIIPDSTTTRAIHLTPGIYSPAEIGEIFPLNCRSYISLQGGGEQFTILDGEGLSRILTCHYDNHFTVKNLTIQNGYSCDYSDYGGGIYCEYSSPNLESVAIRENTGIWGGGISCDDHSNPSLFNVTITGNIATYGGGGISCNDHSNPALANIIISENSANSRGGGMYSMYCSEPNLTNVTISGNTAGYEGGGIWCDGSDPNLTNVTISGNNALYYGGGIYCRDGADPILTNVTISENSARNDGGGIYCYFYSTSPSLANCILWNDTPQEIYVYSGSVTATYSDIQGGWTGTGNIDADPLFADPQNGDFHLTWANFPIQDSTMSPCIDAGDPNSPLDPDSTRADMGAFYFDQNQQGVGDTPSLPTSYFLYQNYPNPFCTSTTISFFTTKLTKETNIT